MSRFFASGPPLKTRVFCTLVIFPREFTRVCALEAELHFEPAGLNFRPKGPQVREFTRVCVLSPLGLIFGPLGFILGPRA